MSDEVMDFLRVRFARLDTWFDRVDRKLDDLGESLGRVESTVEAIRRDIAEWRSR